MYSTQNINIIFKQEFMICSVFISTKVFFTLWTVMISGLAAPAAIRQTYAWPATEINKTKLTSSTHMYTYVCSRILNILGYLCVQNYAADK